MLEVITAERSQQWPLSCYAPIRNHPVVPNLIDTSPEELRSDYYAAKKQGRMQEYINHVNQLHKNAQDMRQFLKEPTAELNALIDDLLSRNVESSGALSTFRFSLDTNKESIQSVATSAAGNIFGRIGENQPEQQFPPGMFTVPPPNIFTPPPNIFGGGNQQPSNLRQPEEQQQNMDTTTYSAELSEQEQAIYAQSVFTFGQIPKNAPTKPLC